MVGNGVVDLEPLQVFQERSNSNVPRRFWAACSMQNFPLRAAPFIDVFKAITAVDVAVGTRGQLAFQLGQALESLVLADMTRKDGKPSAWVWLGCDQALQRAHDVNRFNACYVHTCRTDRDISSCQNMSFVMDKGDLALPMQFAAIAYPDNSAHLCVPQVASETDQPDPIKDQIF